MKSSPEIIILFIFLSLAFLLERKPLNLILNFVGILISLTFLISNEYPEAQYFSFILIIVYTSALSILFGFIIMLNPNNLKLSSITQFNTNILSHSTLIKNQDYWQKDKNISIIRNNKIKSLILLFFILLFLFCIKKEIEFLLDNLETTKNLFDLLYKSWIEWKSYFFSSISNFNWNFFYNSFIDLDIEIFPFNIEIIEKTGRNIYSSPNTIINFIIAIFILLLALISLFFLI